jgi:phage terminase large subunit-like protein
MLQARYREATSELERRAIALEFERLVKAVHAETRRRQSSTNGSLQALLAELGKDGSPAQLVKFFPRFFSHPKGPRIGQPFALEPWQRAFLREFYRRDSKGRRIYRFGLLGLPRGNGKTPLAAGLGLYELVRRADAPEVYCAAGSKEQARICLDFARSFVEAGELAEFVRVRSSLSCPERSGIMQVLSAEGRLQHGRAPAASLLDELWAFETARQEEVYRALTTASHKRVDAFLLAITTAGYDRHSLLGRIYEAALGWQEVTISRNGCLTVAKDEEHGSLLWWYGAPESTDLEDERIWRAVNPASWIELRDLRRQLHDPGLGENDFRRLHLNQWTRTREAWLPDGCWARLRSEAEIPERADVYVGVDVGLVHDSTAVCFAHLLEDGRIALRVHVWSAKEEAPAHVFVPGGRVHLEAVEAFIRELGRRYRVREIAYDPRFFNRSAEILEGEGFELVEFQQASGPMADAYQSFYQEALEGTLTHDGDPVFAAHVEATAAQKSERGWRVRKLKSSQRIDALVAAVLAVARARVNKKKTLAPGIFWMEW